MKLMNFNVCILFAATAIPALCQVTLNIYKGDGYYVSYPSSWNMKVNNSAFALLTPERENQISIKILSSPDTRQSDFFSNYRRYAPSALGFDPTWESSTRPMVYGGWRGNTLDGRGKVNGVNVVVSATAIEANEHFYLLQLVAPLERSWEGHEYLMALGRTLTFERLPKHSTGTGAGGGAGCANCLQIWTSAMDRITATTVKGMR